MWGVKPLQEGQTADARTPDSTDPEANTRALKALSHYLGSSITGICEIPDYCWYSHDKRGQPIEPYHKYALVVLIDQGHETVLGATGNDWISGAQSMRSYLRGAEAVGVMAAMIREMGWPARGPFEPRQPRPARPAGPAGRARRAEPGSARARSTPSSACASRPRC